MRSRSCSVLQGFFLPAADCRTPEWTRTKKSKKARLTGSVNSHYLQTRGKSRFFVLCRPSTVDCNWSQWSIFGNRNGFLSKKHSFCKRETLKMFCARLRREANPKPRKTLFSFHFISKGVWGALIDFQKDITLILDYTLIAQITVLNRPFWEKCRFSTSSKRTDGIQEKLVFALFLEPAVH